MVPMATGFTSETDMSEPPEDEPGHALTRGGLGSGKGKGHERSSSQREEGIRQGRRHGRGVIPEDAHEVFPCARRVVLILDEQLPSLTLADRLHRPAPLVCVWWCGPDPSKGVGVSQCPCTQSTRTL